ncbi:MAG: 1,4-dihydroxy-6-naphthoate synthase [Desulfococcaceae bacterium]|jgi:1,4-dihydroxy-6-naphthoate synthase|nr:1,4-dihydroxy-6-naphthoate synthase [Desulfococcaceae bacterium]
MKQKISLAYSTCPNDTFLFYALAHRKIDCRGLQFDIVLADVETLNQEAAAGTYDISKLSFSAIARLQDSYGLLRSGAALGRGCGPLIVAKSGFDIARLHSVNIAVPGLKTTAAMLLSLFLARQPQMTAMVFDRIMPRVAAGEYEAGLIIHEGRFTYPEYGLSCLADLGQWWEEKTALPIPLGGIAVRRDLGPEIAEKAEKVIRDSVAYAFANPKAADTYIREHALEMDPAVIRQHIDLYVNSFTQNLGEEGERAVRSLFEMGRKYRILPESSAALFACG